MEKFVLDSCGLIAFLRKEDGYSKVRNKIESSTMGTIELFIHKATIIEIYYDSLKTDGLTKADDILRLIHLMSMTEVEKIDDGFIRKASYFKTKYKISFADSFVLALGITEDAKIITADHHEFDIIETNGDAKFEWFR